jgi:hypothetical protein
MEIQCRFGARLAVTQAGELFAVAEQKLDLETRPIQLHQLTAVQGQLCGGQPDGARLGWGLPVDNDHEAQRALKRDMPDDGRIQMQMVRLRQGAEGLKTVEVLKMDFPIILTPRPAALWVRAGGEKPTVGVASQLGNRVQVETDRFIKVLLLGKVPVHAMLGDLRRQAVPLRTQLLPIKIHSGLFLGLRRARLVIAWGGWATARVKAQRRVTSTTASVETSRPRSAREVQPLKKCPSPNVCLPLFGMKDASCAEITSEPGSRATILTR